MELYVNKNGWKCVESQLAKTEGYDPQEFEALKAQYRDDPVGFNTAKSKLRLRVLKYQG